MELTPKASCEGEENHKRLAGNTKKKHVTHTHNKYIQLAMCIYQGLSACISYRAVRMHFSGRLPAVHLCAVSVSRMRSSHALRCAFCLILHCHCRQVSPLRHQICLTVAIYQQYDLLLLCFVLVYFICTHLNIFLSPWPFIFIAHTLCLSLQLICISEIFQIYSVYFSLNCWALTFHEKYTFKL